MKTFIQDIRELQTSLDNGLISPCGFVDAIQERVVRMDWNEYFKAQKKELEDATITLVHIESPTHCKKIEQAIISLRLAAYEVSHDKRGTFFCISPKDSWGAVHRTEGADPRFLLDVANSLTQ